MDHGRSREIRIFISSTFKDMQAERDYLFSHVFPVVRKACLERDVVLSEIDLRWGITEEESRNGRTIEICVDEIERCRASGRTPFFIGLLGERYGWVPDPGDLRSFWEQRPDSPHAGQIRRALEQGISVTELEMRVGVLEPAEPATRARVYLRSPEFTGQLAHAASEPSAFADADPRQAALKDRLRASGNVGIDGYASLEELGADVLDYLLRELDDIYPLEDAPDPQTRDSQAHAHYALSRLQAYVPLPDFRALIEDACAAQWNQDDASPIQVVAPSGYGKSAFLADLARSVDATCFAHYTGADGNRTLAHWRDRLIAWLQRAGLADAQLPNDDDGRWAALPTLLGMAAQRAPKPLLLTLDALNQMEDPGQALDRLSHLPLPRGVALVVTCTPEAASPTWTTFQLPPLDGAARARVVGAFLQLYGKSISPAQADMLAGAGNCAVPLFLRLVLEELRLHPNHETLSDELGRLLAMPDTPALFRDALRSMDAEYGDGGLVSILLGYMSLSRRGLARADLARLAPPAGLDRIPDRILSPVISRLLPYLVNDNGRYRLMHGILEAALDLDDTATRTAREHLARHFTGEDGEAVAERVFQLLMLGDLAGIGRTLSPPAAALALHGTDPELARRALAAMGAGLTTPTGDLHALASSWHGSIAGAAIDLQKAFDFARALEEWHFVGVGLAWTSALVDRVSGRREELNWIGQALGTLSKLHRASGDLGQAEAALARLEGILAKVDPGNVEVRMELKMTLAGIRRNQGRPAEAEALYREIAAHFERTPGIPPRVLAVAYDNLAVALGEQAKLEEAEAAYLKALEYDRATGMQQTMDSASIMNNLALLYSMTGRFAEASAMLERVLAIMSVHLPPNHPKRAATLDAVGMLQRKQGDFDAARKTYREALAIWRACKAPDHPDVATCLVHCAQLEAAARRPYEAVAWFRSAESILRKHLPAQAEALGLVLVSLAQLCEETEPDQALALCTEALAITSPDSRVMAGARIEAFRILAASHQRLGDAIAAVDARCDELATRWKFGEGAPAVLLQHSLELVSPLLGAGHDAKCIELFSAAAGAIDPRSAEGAMLPKIAEMVLSLHLKAGQEEQAETWMRRLLEFRRARLPEDPEELMVDLATVAARMRERQRWAEAEPLYREIVALRRQYAPDNAQALVRSLNDHGMTLTQQGNHAAAEPVLAEALAGWRAMEDPPPGILALACENLATCHQELGRLDSAAQLLREAIGLRRAHLPDDRAGLALRLVNLATALQGLGDAAGCVPVLEEALAIRLADQGRSGDAANPAFLLGRALRALGRDAEAEPHYRTALDLLRARLPPGHLDLFPVMKELADLRAKAGDFAGAIAIHAEAAVLLCRGLGPEHPHIRQYLAELHRLHVLAGREQDFQAFLDGLLAQLRNMGPVQGTAPAGDHSQH